MGITDAHGTPVALFVESASPAEVTLVERTLDCRFTTALQMGRAWGSRVVRIGNVGHLNPASGFGRWPRAHEFIRELSRPRQAVAS